MRGVPFAAPHAFPVQLHVLARREAAEVLRDVAARDRVGAGQRQGRHGRRVGAAGGAGDEENPAADVAAALQFIAFLSCSRHVAPGDRWREPV